MELLRWLHIRSPEAWSQYPYRFPTRTSDGTLYLKSICFSACGIFSIQCTNVTNGIISFSLNCKSYVTSSCGFYLRTTSLLSSKCVLINPAQTLLYHLRLLHTVTEWEGKPDSALFSLNPHWFPGPSAGHVQGPCHLTPITFPVSFPPNFPTCFPPHPPKHHTVPLYRHGL